MSERSFRIVLDALYLASAAVVLWLLWAGAGFFLTPYQDRPQHPDYLPLRPAGSWGHGVGIIGSLMMILLLGYSLRKRWRSLQRAGSLKRWLGVHIYFGIFGPLLVILHSTFKVQGLVALSFWSMIAVALSGVLGRYLYLQIPRNLQGDALDLKALESEDADLAVALSRDFSFDGEAVARLQDLGALAPGASLAGALFQSLISDITLGGRLRRFLRQQASAPALPGAQRRRLIRLARRKAILHRRRLLLERLQQIFHYWHVIHKPFAIVMLLIMAIHVAVTVLLGYRWVF